MLPVPCIILSFAESSADVYSQMIRTGIIDERILGDGEFTQFVLDETKERLEERYRLQVQGYDLDKVSKKLGVSHPSVSISVKRGEKIAKTEQLEPGES
jgi:hypothetical protein